MRSTKRYGCLKLIVLTSALVLNPLDKCRNLGENVLIYAVAEPTSQGRGEKVSKLRALRKHVQAGEGSQRTG